MQPLPLAYWQTRAHRRVRVEGCPVLKITSTLAEAVGSIVTLQSGQTWGQGSTIAPQPAQKLTPLVRGNSVNRCNLPVVLITLSERHLLR